MTTYGQSWTNQRMNSRSRIAWGTQFLGPSTRLQIMAALYVNPLPAPEPKPISQSAHQSATADTSVTGDAFERCTSAIRAAKRIRDTQLASLRRKRSRNTLVGQAFTSAVDQVDREYEASKVDAWAAYYAAVGQPEKAAELRAEAAVAAARSANLSADSPSQVGAVLGETVSSDGYSQPNGGPSRE